MDFVLLSAVNNAKDDNMVLIWLYIPCTGGSPWQNIKQLLPGGEERVQGHVKIFKALWKKLVIFVDRIHPI